MEDVLAGNVLKALWKIECSGSEGWETAFCLHGTLLVPQRIDGVQQCGFPRRVEAEKNPDCD